MSSIGPSLRKSARNFRLSTDQTTQLVNVQASMWNDRNEGPFTVNLAVFFPAIADLRQLGVERSSRTDCMIVERIGGLMPDGCDYWWEVSASSDDDAVAAELRDAVVEFGLPWLARLANPDVGAEHTGPTSMPRVRAELQFLKGDRASAITTMTNAISRSPRAVEYWRPFAIATGLEAESQAARED